MSYTILRAINNLSTGHRRGDAFLATELDAKNIPILIRVQAVKPIETPPPELLSGFEEYAGRYESLGAMLLDDEVGDDVKRKIWRLLDLECDNSSCNCNRR